MRVFVSNVAVKMVLLALCLAEECINIDAAFASRHTINPSQQRDVRESTHCVSRRDTSLGITLPWLSGKSQGDAGIDTIEARENSKASSLGGVAGIMESMDSFKKAQSIGKRTSALVQELSATTVEGASQDGKVKVVFDCQQRPISTSIDEAYLQAADASDVANAVTAAMQEAHAKSIERMEDKMKPFYSELGLPSS